MASEKKEAEYHFKDFEWEDLRDEVEKDPSIRYHLSPPPPPSASPSTPPIHDADAWRSFHSRHSTGRFFKERRYLLKEFPELLVCGDYAKILEVGCGNGSTVLPILRAKESNDVYACDCSTGVLERAKEMITAAEGESVGHRFHPFLHDFSVNQLPSWLFCASCKKNSKAKTISVSSDVNENPKIPYESSLSSGVKCCIGGVDFVTLIFTLSAVPLQQMPFVIKECFSVLKPGCLLLFRDYGLYDMTMLRFTSEQRKGFREYIRSDGTLSYFFSLDVVRNLFYDASFTELELEYCCVRSVNRKTAKIMQRVWVHGKFQKPI